jgi:hypothetical protein
VSCLLTNLFFRRIYSAVFCTAACVESHHCNINLCLRESWFINVPQSVTVTIYRNFKSSHEWMLPKYQLTCSHHAFTVFDALFLHDGWNEHYINHKYIVWVENVLAKELPVLGSWRKPNIVICSTVSDMVKNIFGICVKTRLLVVTSACDWAFA